MAPVLAQSARSYLRPRVFHVYPEFSIRPRVFHLDPAFSTRARVSYLDPVFSTRARVFHQTLRFPLRPRVFHQTPRFPHPGTPYPVPRAPRPRPRVFHLAFSYGTYAFYREKASSFSFSYPLKKGIKEALIAGWLHKKSGNEKWS